MYQLLKVQTVTIKMLHTYNHPITSIQTKNKTEQTKWLNHKYILWIENYPIQILHT